MKKFKHLWWVILLISVAACMPSTQTSEVTGTPMEATATQEPAVPTQTSTPVETGLTVERLNNSVFFAPVYSKTAQLINGQHSGMDANVEYTVTLLPQIAIGDLNGDHVNDAAVLLSENWGGTGEFVSLVVIGSGDGSYTQMGSALIDDRPLIQSLTINNGQINLQATIHNINDIMTEPTLAIQRTYRILDHSLELMAQRSTIPDAAERSITIDIPIDGAEVSNPIQITGSMPIAPFENNLSCTIYDLDGHVLYQNGFMVTAVDVGGQATFDNSIKLENFSAGQWVRIELAELSMADGSLMTSSSVVVKYQ